MKNASEYAYSLWCFMVLMSIALPPGIFNLKMVLNLIKAGTDFIVQYLFNLLIFFLNKVEFEGPDNKRT